MAGVKRSDLRVAVDIANADDANAPFALVIIVWHLVEPRILGAFDGDWQTAPDELCASCQGDFQLVLGRFAVQVNIIERSIRSHAPANRAEIAGRTEDG